MQEIGEVFQYYGKIGVAAIKLSKKLKVGEKIKIQGHTTDFEQKVKSIQVEHEKLTEAKAGTEIGIKVEDKVRRHDKVYRAE